MGGDKVPGPLDPLVEWFEKWKVGIMTEEEDVMKLVFLFRVTDREMAHKIREELYTFIQENSELKKRYCGKSIQEL